MVLRECPRCYGIGRISWQYPNGLFFLKLLAGESEFTCPLCKGTGYIDDGTIGIRRYDLKGSFGAEDIYDKIIGVLSATNYNDDLHSKTKTAIQLLEKLDELRNSGTITEEDFKKIKAKLLDKL